MRTLQEALTDGARLLAQADIQGARVEAQVLLSYATDIERARLYTYPEQTLTVEQEARYQDALQRRARHEPAAYIIGYKAFYGLDFVVDQRVLIPRPETELLVEAALAHIAARIDQGGLPIVADIGTGSGAIPITLAVEESRLPFLYACDISPDALAVTQINCARHQVCARLRLLEGDLLAPLPEPVDILLANLPYVGTRETPEMSVDVIDYEPHLALFSGPDGLDLLARLCEQAHATGKLKAGGLILLEIGYQQAQAVTSLIHRFWPQASVSHKQDYAGWDRLIEVRV